MSDSTMRSKALDLAINLSSPETTESVMVVAEQILAFFEECSGEYDLRLKAISAAGVISIRGNEEFLHVALTRDARVFLEFLNGTTSSASPLPCEAAELRSGAE